MRQTATPDQPVSVGNTVVDWQNVSPKLGVPVIRLSVARLIQRCRDSRLNCWNLRFLIDEFRLKNL
ncbi:hypothetical protein THIOM_000152 [Candidatus Thiomargarita nelsonii]|uniref:Uncharacterized protein n=1 Tax=Candidatus Thiomargarita nelsonii TaxID=1003181 RepID=A0A176S806_9GAMM|nr:hypothetical protein THIOM_000152 [Candidatus Thiomargarita nelsonii]